MSLTELADRVGVTIANLSISQDRQGPGDPVLDLGGALQGVGSASPAIW